MVDKPFIISIAGDSASGKSTIANFIRIYYDGNLVFQCTDKNILKWFNREDVSQYIILNHGLHRAHTNNPQESSMLIKSIKVYQKS